MQENYKKRLGNLGKELDNTEPQEYWNLQVIAETLIAEAHLIKSRAANYLHLQKKAAKKQG